MINKFTECCRVAEVHVKIELHCIHGVIRIFHLFHPLHDVCKVNIYDRCYSLWKSIGLKNVYEYTGCFKDTICEIESFFLMKFL